MKGKSLSHVPLFATPWTAAHQAPLSLGFSRQEFWSGLPFPSPVCESEKGKEVVQSCPTLSDPMDCSLPGSSVHGIFQARVLEWVAMPSSRGSSRPRDQTHVSCSAYIADGSFTAEPPGKTTDGLKQIDSYTEVCTQCSLGNLNPSSPTSAILTPSSLPCSPLTLTLPLGCHTETAN